MTLILLTGAGFSRNWGGWLASEAFEYILGRSEVGENLRKLLWTDLAKGRGFEDTLAGLQQRHKQGGDEAAGVMVQEFTLALVAMFNEMNAGLSRSSFEWQNESRWMVGTFLTRFDYIFTLNQDILLECHYLVQGRPYGRFDSAHTPGLKLRNPSSFSVQPKDAKWTPDLTKLKIEPRQQPYIKLHGSSNWLRDGSEPRVMVLGGSKSVEIDQDPLLSWYQKEFSAALHREGAKLMTIGYSFGDKHINEIIGNAAEQGELKIFVVDLAGVHVVLK
jgi:SIR2-like domain